MYEYPWYAVFRKGKRDISKATFKASNLAAAEGIAQVIGAQYHPDADSFEMTDRPITGTTKDQYKRRD